MSLDSGFQVTDKGLMELFRRLEPFIKTMLKAVGGGIKEITSDDGSVSITDPTGPSVDLSSPDTGIVFNGGGVYGATNTGYELNVSTTHSGGTNFNTGIGNFFIQAGGGTTLAIFSPVISMQAGSATFGIGTSSPAVPTAGNDIDAGVSNFRITLGTGGDGFKIIKAAAPHNPIFRVRNAGGSNDFAFYNQAGNPVIQAGIVAAADAVGFFNTGPVNQQAAPTSPQTIANALAAYGLLAGAGTVVVDGGSP